MSSSSNPDLWPVSLRTDRLVLRPIERGDVAALSRLWTDTEVRRHLGGPVTGETLRARQEGCVAAFGAFSVVLATCMSMVGLVSVEPCSRRGGRTEVSYQLLPEHWGCGYGREAVVAAMSWALDKVTSQQSEVVAVTQKANERSRRLLESIGMRLVDAFVEWGAEQVMYSMDRTGPGGPVLTAIRGYGPPSGRSRASTGAIT
ncbi:GNAT family N-acetyltransferase [Streptomyces sp. NBC_00555]|uniref:GNAT family N-acetyltransferase n=1 Tax=Streptomyces sp. NBC_00555 TaxID=2903662 RepID=UPI0022523BC9|nr:GNAT family N-acetyltransferase [Streptomyces sp. NBC_00555]MCX5015280.1 GNAT family N-acetyltransferase [Streptomyces sp. NBC_00555]